MKLKLIRAARIRHDAGEIVEVSPAEAGFLLSTGSAVPVKDEAQVTEKETPENGMTVETPEAGQAVPVKETPEGGKKTVKKNTAKNKGDK